MNEEHEATIVKGMDAIEKFVNNMCLDFSATGEAIGWKYLNMHRTLQQSLIRLLISAIASLAKYYKENPERYDLRNEGAKNWIVKVAEIKDIYLEIVVNTN